MIVGNFQSWADDKKHTNMFLLCVYMVFWEAILRYYDITTSRHHDITISREVCRRWRSIDRSLIRHALSAFIAQAKPSQGETFNPARVVAKLYHIIFVYHIYHIQPLASCRCYCTCEARFGDVCCACPDACMGVTTRCSCELSNCPMSEEKNKTTTTQMSGCMTARLGPTDAEQRLRETIISYHSSPECAYLGRDPPPAVGLPSAAQRGGSRTNTAGYPANANANVNANANAKTTGNHHNHQAAKAAATGHKNVQ